MLTGCVRISKLPTKSLTESANHSNPLINCLILSHVYNPLNSERASRLSK